MLIIMDVPWSGPARTQRATADRDRRM